MIHRVIFHENEFASSHYLFDDLTGQLLHLMGKLFQRKTMSCENSQIAIHM